MKKGTQKRPWNSLRPFPLVYEKERMMVESKDRPAAPRAFQGLVNGLLMSVALWSAGAAIIMVI